MDWQDIIKDEIQKIRSYEGSVIPNIKVPNTFRRWRFGCRKLLKLWYRIEQGNLHWTPLINTLKDISTYYLDLSALYQGEIGSDPVSCAVYISELRRLSAGDYKTSTEIIVDKERERESKRCSICATELVYPAYIVYRNAEGKEVEKSRPIGIMCLNSSLSRFKNLLSQKEFVKLMKQVGKVIENKVNDSPVEDIDILLEMPAKELRALRKDVLDTAMFINMFHNKDKVEKLKERIEKLNEKTNATHIASSF